MNLRFHRVLTDNIAVALFLLLVLFLPKSNELTRYYFAGLLIITPLLLINKRKLNFDFISLIGIGILIIHLSLTLVRFAYIVDPNLRDYTEFARLLLPVLMLIFREKFKNVEVKTLFSVFAIYVSVDFIISILDLMKFDLLGIISLTKSIYVSNVHASVGYRICGLSSGPGQHGVLMSVLFIFFYCRVFQSKRPILPLFFSFLAIVPIFLTHSRTSIVIFAFISILIPGFYFIFGNSPAKRRSLPVLSLIIGVGAFVLIQFQDFFSRLLEILEGLDKITSYQDRVEGYQQIFSKAMEYPAFLVLGYGKEFLRTGVYDNEYIMMFLIFGPAITLIILSGILIYLIKFIAENRKMERSYGTILFFLFLAGLVFAYPTSFFLQPEIMPLSITVLIMTYWENYDYSMNMV